MRTMTPVPPKAGEVRQSGAGKSFLGLGRRWLRRKVRVGTEWASPESTKGRWLVLSACSLCGLGQTARTAKPCRLEAPSQAGLQGLGQYLVSTLQRN